MPGVMIDVILADSVILVALGIEAKSNKHVLGLRGSCTESTRVVEGLLGDLIERGCRDMKIRLAASDAQAEKVAPSEINDDMKVAAQHQHIGAATGSPFNSCLDIALMGDPERMTWPLVWALTSAQACTLCGSMFRTTVSSCRKAPQRPCAN